MRILSITVLVCATGCSDYELTNVGNPAPTTEQPEVKPPEEPEEEEPDPTAPEEEDTPEEPEEEEPPEDDCEDPSDLIYVIERDTEKLYLFDPEEMSFEALGTLDCGIWAGTPASMSVSRDGYAYVRYSDDTVYAVQLDTMHCSETTYGSNFGSFGMGFATDHADTWLDDLYIANASGLARLDTASWALEQIGAMPSQSELTGNADGELWAMLPLESPAELVRLNKHNAEVLEMHTLPGFPSPYDIDTFAFATWGGDFYIFVRVSGMGESTDVYRVTASGHMSVVWENTGLTIVGAGVSTCAPTE